MRNVLRDFVEFSKFKKQWLIFDNEYVFFLTTARIKGEHFENVFPYKVKSNLKNGRFEFRVTSSDWIHVRYIERDTTQTRNFNTEEFLKEYSYLFEVVQ